MIGYTLADQQSGDLTEDFKGLRLYHTDAMKLLKAWDSSVESLTLTYQFRSRNSSRMKSMSRSTRISHRLTKSCSAGVPSICHRYPDTGVLSACAIAFRAEYVTPVRVTPCSVLWATNQLLSHTLIACAVFLKKSCDRGQGAVPWADGEITNAWRHIYGSF